MASQLVRQSSKYQRVRELLEDPLKFQQLCWPDLRLYDKQVDILYSLRDNDETIVPAGNQLGKDFISGLAVLWFFCSRSPARVVTSSSTQSQLKSVLWGEIRRFVATSRYPLPIQMNDLFIRQIQADGSLEPRSYIRGIVTNVPESLQGHHLEKGGLEQREVSAEQKLIWDQLKGHNLDDVYDDLKPRTLSVFDEASGIDSVCKDMTDTWAHRTLIIGNCLPCTNFFFRAVEDGDIPREETGGYHRKVIRIKADESPNVRLAEARVAKGMPPGNEILIPGVIDYQTYRKRRKLWDPIRQCIGLDAAFYKGAEVLLYPPEWLNRAEEIAKQLENKRIKRKAKTMGVDAAEGGDSTVWTIIDELGILEQYSIKTSNTADIPGITIQFIRKYSLDASDVLFDRGGGGKQHADVLREKGYNVRTIGFGEAPTDPALRRRLSRDTRKEQVEEKYLYKNRRAEMYGLLRFNLLDPVLQTLDEESGEYRRGFGIPAEYTELRRQLSPLPLLWDGEGRMWLPPKDKPNKDYKGDTIKQILGRSPDEADSFALAVFGLMNPDKPRVLTAI